MADNSYGLAHLLDNLVSSLLQKLYILNTARLSATIYVCTIAYLFSRHLSFE